MNKNKYPPTNIILQTFVFYVKNNSTMYNYWTIIHFPNNELNIKFFNGILALKYRGYINNKLQKYHGLWSLGTQMIRLKGLVWV
jgi:hypothetical protein